MAERIFFLIVFRRCKPQPSRPNTPKKAEKKAHLQFLYANSGYSPMILIERDAAEAEQEAVQSRDLRARISLLTNRASRTQVWNA